MESAGLIRRWPTVARLLSSTIVDADDRVTVRGGNTIHDDNDPTADHRHDNCLLARSL